MSTQTALVINGSPRPRQNTAWISSVVIQELQKNQVTTRPVSAVSLKTVNNGCIGCEGCQRSKEFLCVFKDDIQPLVASMPNYDYVIFATPVYFFSPTAQIKLVLDRMFSLLKADSEGNFRTPFNKNTTFGLIVTAGGDEHEGCDLVLDIFKRTADIFKQPFESLLLPNAPLSPDEITSPDAWRQQAIDFCGRLLKS